MRLFVAIELDESVRTKLARLQKELARACEGIRWIPAKQLHLTVKFLGEVEDRRVAEICRSVEAGVKGVPAFDMTVEGCGCFPPRGAVRIVWAGCQDPSGLLSRCVASACGPLEAAGFPPEDRPFSPHITIGRVKDDRSGGGIRRAVAESSFPGVAQWVESVTVMSSVLSPKGPSYTAVSRAKLA